jgi:hypothetical protein
MTNFKINYTNKGNIMTKIIIFLCFMLIGNTTIIAQANSSKLVKYTPSYKFNDGVFLNFRQVLGNSPIKKERIISSADPYGFNFFEEILKQEVISFYDDLGIRKTVNKKNVWGYANNGVLFIQWNNEFNRIPVVGSLSHFVANKVTYQTNYYDPYYYNYYNRYSHNTIRQSPTVELQQYLIDFESGEVYEFNVKSLLITLMGDPELYDEFNSLRSKKQKKLLFLYLRKYNERNPLYLPAQKK